MANFTDRLVLIVDAVTQTARKDLQQLDRQLATTGQTASPQGKFGAALRGIGPLAVGAASVAGAAIGKFAVDSANQFKNLAIEVDNFSKATGTTLDESSRWIEVAGDLGINTDLVTRGIGKMNREIANSPQAFAELGVEIARTADGTVNANETFLRVVDALAKMQDPAKKAVLAQQILGRSWTELTPLIGAHDQLRDRMERVADVKIIDERDVEAARGLRDAQDRLGDALQEIGLTVGENLVPALADATETAGQLLEVLADLSELDPFAWATGGELSIFTGGLTAAKEVIDGFSGDVQGAAADLQSISGGDFSGTVTSLGGLSDAASTAAEEVGTLSDRFAGLLGVLGAEDLLLDVADGFDQVRQTAVDSYNAAAEGAADAAAKGRDHERQVNDLTRTVIEYADEVGGIPDETLTEIIAHLQRGEIDEAERRFQAVSKDRQSDIHAVALTGSAEADLDRVARDRTARISAVVIGSALARGAVLPGRQAGGPIPGPAGAPYPVLAHGGEFVLSADVVDAIKKGGKTEGLGARGGFGGFGGSGTTIVMQPGAIVLNYPANAQVGRQVVEAIRAYERQGGR